MANDEVEVGWKDAVTGGNFVTFETETEKVVVIKNWKTVKTTSRFEAGKETVEFRCDVIEEDGKACDKKISMDSNPFKIKIKPILENLDRDKPVKLSVFRIGEKTKTAYSIKKLQM